MNFIKQTISKLTDNKKPDFLIFFLSSILIITSVIFSYSLSIYTVVFWDYNQFHFFYRQLFTGILAILIMWSFSYIKPDILIPKIGNSFLWFFLALIIIMQFLPSSFVTESGGAKRWIRLPGFSLSPVEFFKIGFIYFLAHSFNKHLSELKNLPFKEELKLVAPYALIFLVVVLLIAVFQKDLGQVVLLGSILFIMLIFSNRSWKLFVFIISLALIGIIALILFFPHRITRIKSWWSMVQDNILGLDIMPQFLADMLRVKNFPEPYQVSNSLNAIHNGGFFGTGLGEGSLKLGFLSEVHTDFVLAGITEEIGLLGLSSILLILFTIIFRIFRISRRIKDNTYHLFTLGIGVMISIAFLINAYGISGIIPIKGIAVPFLSYGGSSMLGLSIAIGMVLSISRELHNEK